MIGQRSRLRMVLLAAVAVGCADAPLEVGETAPAPIPATSEGPGEPERTARTPAPPSQGTPVGDDAPKPVPAAPAEPVLGLECELCSDVPRMASLTRYPIILAHGMAGFDSFGPLEYWVGVEDALREAGYAVYVGVVEPLNGSDVRGPQLAEFIDRVRRCTCSDKVNVIGHSQGGIDIRYVIGAMGYGDRIASATSIASPHRGSPVADIALGLIPGALDDVLNAVAWLIAEIYTDPKESIELRAALTWCSSEHLLQFDQDYPQDAQVPWYSYAGRAGLTANGKPECEGAPLPNPKARIALTAPLLPTWTAMGGLTGHDNDGLVPVESAKWGEFRGCLAADHVQEIGMFVGVLPTFDHLAFFLEHAAFLTERGH